MYLWSEIPNLWKEWGNSLRNDTIISEYVVYWSCNFTCIRNQEGVFFVHTDVYVQLRATCVLTMWALKKEDCTLKIINISIKLILEQKYHMTIWSCIHK